MGKSIVTSDPLRRTLRSKLDDASGRCSVCEKPLDEHTDEELKTCNRFAEDSLLDSET